MTLIICFLSCDNSLQKTIQYFKKKENNNKKDNNKEKFINPIVNGFHRRCNCFRCLSLNPFHHSQRRFSNMNIPLIKNSLANFECRNIKTISSGDHFIFICKVLKLKINEHLKPLVYVNNRYN